MILRRQCKDKITIERRDGTRQEGVLSAITDKMILIPDASIPISVGDAILRALPSGLVERFIVTDPKFYSGRGGMEDHYQIKFRREGQRQAGLPGYNIHISGENSRVNINSTDNSTNNIGFKSEDLSDLAIQLFNLRQTALSKANEPEHYISIGHIASAELAAKEGDTSKVQKALSMLGSGGRWLFDTAKEIGVQVAAEAIKPHLGLPPSG